MTPTTASTIAPPTLWYKAWFDTSYYHHLYAGHDDREAANLVNALVAYMRPAPGARMLDVGCGAGRHARALAAHGFDVTGFDLSGSSIRMARERVTGSLRFHVHDMRRPFGRRRFDYVFNFFTSFGYFADEAEHACVMRNLTAAVEPGGALLIDYLNVELAERNLVKDEVKELTGARYRLKRWSDATHIFKSIAIEDAERGAYVRHEERLAKFRRADFDRMLGRQGMRITEVFGDYGLGPFDVATSPRLIMIARHAS